MQIVLNVRELLINIGDRGNSLILLSFGTRCITGVLGFTKNVTIVLLLLQ